jgi:hypothetical protein
MQLNARVSRLVVLSQAVALAISLAHPLDAQAPSLCLATDTRTSAPHAELRAGKYRLTLAASNGQWRGKQVSGSLELRKTTSTDRSPRTGQAARDSLALTPLWGATDVKFHVVGAPVLASDTLVPSPTSLDPVYPGVLVTILRSPIRANPVGNILLIGTLTNRRADIGWMDGPGIALAVRQVDSSGFRGTWQEWGIVMGGRGYFCAILSQPWNLDSPSSHR